MKLITTILLSALSFSAYASNMSEMCSSMADAMVQTYNASQKGVPKYKVKKIMRDNFRDSGVNNAETIEAVAEMMDSVYELPSGLSHSKIRNVIINNCGN